MQIGFALPTSGPWHTPAAIRHVATRAEELGYHSLWTFQRLLCDVDGEWGAVYRSVHDPVVTLGFAAALTTRVRLGVAVLNMPFASPALVAKQAATLDILSGGRLDLGLGLGWAEEEYTASGVAMRDRGRRGDDFLAALATLLGDDIVEHHGEFYTVPRSRMEPKPIQRPRPPLLLGGAAPAALRRVGRLADGWVSSSRADPTTLGASVAVIRSAAERAGRDPASLRFVCRAATRVRHTGERAPMMGTPDEIRGDLAMLAAQGITETFIDLNFDPQIAQGGADESLGRADEVLSALAP